MNDYRPGNYQGCTYLLSAVRVFDGEGWHLFIQDIILPNGKAREEIEFDKIFDTKVEAFDFGDSHMESLIV